MGCLIIWSDFVYDGTITSAILNASDTIIHSSQLAWASARSYTYNSTQNKIMKERKTIRSGMNSFVLLERNLGFPPLMVGCLFVCLFVVLVAGATADHPTPPTMEPPQILVLVCLLLLLLLLLLLSSSSTVSCIYRSTENCSGIIKYIYISLELFFSQRRL